jgi:hypothetical protein
MFVALLSFWATEYGRMPWGYYFANLSQHFSWSTVNLSVCGTIVFWATEYGRMPWGGY